jgi:hypothetical protein
MSLERYNQILWAVVGTLVVLGALVLAVILFITRTREDRSPTIVIGKPNQPKVNQNLVFCEPIVVPGTNRQLLPVAAVDVDDPHSEKIVVQYEARLSRGSGYYDPSRCTLGSYSTGTRIFNVVMRNSATGRQWLLLERPAQIAAVNVPAKDCQSSQAVFPCGLIQWQIRDRDTNKDGVIDTKDALVVYHSNLQAEELKPVTPPNTSLLSFVWDRDRNALLYQVRLDANGNGEFEKGEPTEILEFVVGKSTAAQAIVDEKIRKELLSHIQ